MAGEEGGREKEISTAYRSLAIDHIFAHFLFSWSTFAQFKHAIIA
jgi:hypothetical protein